MEVVNDRTCQRHPLVRRVGEFVRRHRLIQPGDRVLVAVSGGPDSVCLLTVLAELRDGGWIPGLQLHAAHVNYGLRGADSETDEALVREVGARMGVPVSCERVQVAKEQASLQRQARDIRYAFFARVLREYGLATVATGHTADDQAETVLLWLVRGSGTKGLAGIPVMRVMENVPGSRVVRPLLEVSREEVLAYLVSCGIPYRLDASNVTALYRRNRIRHELLPLLRSLNPRIVEGLARTAEILSADAAGLEAVESDRWKEILIEAAPGRVVLSRQCLATQSVGLQRRVVRRALALVRGRATGLTFRHVEALLDGRRRALPGGIRVEYDGDHVSILYLDLMQDKA
jgi:tRNA(Ile)-lysidine synthase